MLATRTKKVEKTDRQRIKATDTETGIYCKCVLLIREFGRYWRQVMRVLDEIMLT